jgi:hypothetical protein
MADQIFISRRLEIAANHVAKEFVACAAVEDANMTA